jgi:hypothetical protein
MPGCGPCEERVKIASQHSPSHRERLARLQAEESETPLTLSLSRQARLGELAT